MITIVAILRRRIILQTAQYFLSEGQQTIGVICFSDADFDDDYDDDDD